MPLFREQLTVLWQALSNPRSLYISSGISLPLHLLATRQTRQIVKQASQDPGNRQNLDKTLLYRQSTAKFQLDNLEKMPGSSAITAPYYRPYKMH